MPSKKSTKPKQASKPKKTTKPKESDAKISSKANLKADEKPKNPSKLRRLRPHSPFRGYFVDSWREIKRVKWPKRKEAWKLTIAVIVFAVVFSAFLAGLDYGFAELAKLLFLNS